ncbi:phage tail protein [Pseudomonas nitroreducens]|uniref:phage tail protein n=1 Tax=Pseudomonas nitroreducens TaxID=46680 RepID=UPI002FE03BC6
MSTGNLLGGAAGGVAGYFAAGPLGISVGAGIIGGAIIGSLLGGLSSGQKMVMEYGKLSSRNWQGSEYGGDIPRGYGTFPATGSQIVWLEHNKLKEKVKKKKSGGKGGGSSTTTKTYTYFATFALMLCQGEISGVRRIWCGDKLIYNAGSDDLETIIASNQAAKNWKLYRGTDDQLPDPRYEADVGVGNAPAFRGYTYIAFYDFALADYSNTLQAAQFKVELVDEVAGSGLRSYLATTNTGITLNETATVTASSGGVFSLWIDPSDPRPEYGSTANYREYLYRISDGQFLGSVQSQLVLTNPITTDHNYPIGRASGYSWSYHFNAGRSVVSVVGIPDGGTISDAITLTPYSGEGRVGFGAYTVDGLLYVFRQRADGSTYFEIYSGASIESTGEILNANGTPYTRSIGNYEYHQDAGDIPVVEVGGSALWLLSAATVSARIYVAIREGENFVIRQNIVNSLSTNYASGSAADGVLTVPARDKIRTFIRTPVVDRAQRSLADVILAETALSSLIGPTDVDVSLMTQQVSGYRVSGGTIRSVIEPLQGAYPFDVVPSGYKIKFVPRGQSSVVTIPWEDLAAANGDEIGDSLPYSREMDSQLPQRVTITALSSTREYGAATQSFERLNTSAVNVEQRDIPLVLSDDEIAQMAEKLLFLRWLERDDFSFSLPPVYLELDPADVVTVQAKFGTFQLRITEINYEADGRLTCNAKLNNAALYTSRAVGAEGPGPSGTIPLAGQSVALLLDIPVVDETVQNSSGFVGLMSGFTDGWPGGVLIRSNDSGQTWMDLQAFVGKPTVGTVATALPASPCTVIDYRAVSVLLVSGELESITRDQMLTGMNYAAYGIDGRWEIVRFMNAVLQADGTYRVSGFVRGDRGTEWASGLHQAGDYFVLLDDPDNLFIGSPIEAIGLTRLYRAVTSGASIDEASDLSFAYRGVNLECLSPVYAKGSRDGSSNFSGTFTRRSRLSSSWWTNGVQAPVGETTEAYEIDVLSGTTVKRTISVTSPAWTYSATDQIADFGSAQSSITFRIYQLSGTVGRGYPLEVIL